MNVMRLNDQLPSTIQLDSCLFFTSQKTGLERYLLCAPL